MFVDSLFLVFLPSRNRSTGLSPFSIDSNTDFSFSLLFYSILLSSMVGFQSVNLCFFFFGVFFVSFLYRFISCYSYKLPLKVSIALNPWKNFIRRKFISQNLSLILAGSSSSTHKTSVFIFLFFSFLSDSFLQFTFFGYVVFCVVVRKRARNVSLRARFAESVCLSSPSIPHTPR